MSTPAASNNNNNNNTAAAAAPASAAAPAAAAAPATATQQQLPGPGAPGSNYSSASLYVGELHPEATETMLFDVFRTVGPIASMRICRDAVTRRSLGYAYVNFHNPEDAERALDTLNYTPIRGKPCRIMWSHRDPSLRRSGQGNVFIKNLDKSIDNKALFDTFSMFGNILSCKVATDEHGQSKGYGFVHYETQEAADQAIAKVNNMLLNGKIVTVCKFLPKRDRAHGGVDMSKFTNIYVKNLDLSTKDEDIKKLFSRFGQINSCVIMTEGEGGKSKGFGFINFEKPESAKQAVEEMNGQMVDGKVIYVGRAQKKAEREAELKAKFEQQKLERMAKEAGVNLYIKNLDDSFDDEKLRAEFTSFGNITSAKVMRDDKGTSKGFGFVCFTTPEEATKAITEMNGKMIANKPIYVALAQRKDVRRAQLESYHRAQQNFARAGFPSNVYAPMGPVYYPPPQGAAMPRGAQPGFVAYPPQQMLPRGRWTAPQGQMPRQGAAGYNYGVMPVNQRQGRGGRQQGRGAPQGAGRGGHQAAAPVAGAGAPAAGGAPADANRGFKWTKEARNKDAAESAAAAAATTSTAGADGAAAAAAGAAAPSAEDRKQMLGESLFPLVYAVQPNEAGKITGMLLELGVPEVLELLENPVALSAKIQEAMAVLKASGEETA